MIDSDSDSTRQVPIRRIRGDTAQAVVDPVAVEEPMEIRVAFGPDAKRSARSLSITMRTPGCDKELAVGFLFTEGIVRRPADVRSAEFCGPPAPGRSTSNIVRVELSPDVTLDLERLQRHFFSTSSCGICGKASLDALHVQGLKTLSRSGPCFSASLLRGLPDRLRAAQPLFDETGGIHAAGLVDVTGQLLDVREDVGRHNAVDKLLGAQFLDGHTVLDDRALVVSGRSSFEILQKALVACVPVLVAVGAPSSLAVEMAVRFGMTLVGFASNERLNVYSAPERIMLE